MTRNAETYASYLKLPELLALQERLTDAHDELQFIIVHQVFELWFRLALFELDALRDHLAQGDMGQALHLLARLKAIVTHLTSSFEVIETMRPHDFLQFRELLQPASGLQSLQYREIEAVCGLRDPAYLALWSGSDAERLQARFTEPSVWDRFVERLSAHGHAVDSPAQQVAAVIAVISHPESHPLGALTESLIDFDQRFSLWRSRHLTMVMRMIGHRPGTGVTSVERLAEQGYQAMGQSGVDYLRSTMGRLLFPVLWEARTFVQR